MRATGLVSVLSGRLRVRDARLCDDAFVVRLGARLVELAAVESASFDCRTGSLLLLHRLGEKLEEVVALLENAGLGGLASTKEPARPSEVPSSVPAPERPKAKANGTGVRRALNLGMLASFGLNLGALVTGTKKLHSVSGVVFAALLAEHLRRHRKNLF